MFEQIGNTIYKIVNKIKSINYINGLKKIYKLIEEMVCSFLEYITNKLNGLEYPDSNYGMERKYISSTMSGGSYSSTCQGNYLSTAQGGGSVIEDESLKEYDPIAEIKPILDVSDETLYLKARNIAHSIEEIEERLKKINDRLNNK